MVQLGQFIYVTWLDYGSPVPVLRGIKPNTKRRPCVGDPKDLISSDFLNAKKVETRTKSKGKVKKVVGSEEGSLRRLSFGNGKVGGGMESRRMSLDSARRGWNSSVQNKNGGKGSSKSKPKDTSSPSHSGPLVDPQRFMDVEQQLQDALVEIARQKEEMRQKDEQTDARFQAQQRMFEEILARLPPGPTGPTPPTGPSS
ncbi:uncharacterized protein LOC131006423 [Salvia miltiorrhiza]|uniref:uncharacterized protein LOC131006423 n=1 Tax=Salvia miltiorrhiza TaxID=226208 RepID=UPI0025ACE2A5|nr:uncharacterized protein LOC131006423 [Salvia miltiorrhiza]